MLDRVADAFNPLLTLLALAAPFLRRPRTWRAAIVYYLSAGAAISFVYLIRALDLELRIWPRFGLDFSTHSAFAASLATSLALFRRRWTIPLLVAIALYFGLELFMRYHGIADIVTSALIASAAAFLVNLFVVKWDTDAK